MYVYICTFLCIFVSKYPLCVCVLFCNIFVHVAYGFISWILLYFVSKSVYIHTCVHVFHASVLMNQNISVLMYYMKYNICVHICVFVCVLYLYMFVLL